MFDYGSEGGGYVEMVFTSSVEDGEDLFSWCCFSTVNLSPADAQFVNVLRIEPVILCMPGVFYNDFKGLDEFQKSLIIVFNI